MTQQRQRVVVAMSGGVDSSVAAFLLKEKGYEVIGISLKTWDASPEDISRGKTCCSFKDIEDARSVCQRLGIPFYSFNYQKIFREKVIEPFVSEYLNARTPNPCILCNRHIKFDQLFEEAKRMDAYLATGHHARVARDSDGAYKLLKGVDPQKDQSYVLYSLTQDELSRVLLPIGDYTKEEVRKIALENNVPTAIKPESQDICFIPNRDHASFIQKTLQERKLEKGNFVDSKGKILGKHEGIHAYTVGQRRGLGIGFGERMYVTKIMPERNEVELGPVDTLRKEGLFASQLTWTNPHWARLIAEGPLECEIKVRYQKNEMKARLTKLKDREWAEVVFLETKTHPALSPGQSAVFYRGDEVLGGGVIEGSF